MKKIEDIVVVGDEQNEFIIEITSRSDPSRQSPQRFRVVDRSGSLSPAKIKEKLISSLTGKVASSSTTTAPVVNNKKYWKRWKQREDNLIRKIVTKKGKNEITIQWLSQKLKRPEITIRTRVNLLMKNVKLPLHETLPKLKSWKRWTKGEVGTLQKHIGKMTPGKIHKTFFPGKTKSAVYTKLSLLKRGKVDLVKLWHEEGKPNIKLSEVKSEH